MHCVPVEILQQIFKLACTDGGYTGCSLALTSKFVREAAQSTRFHSIAVGAQTERLAALVALYKGLCSNVAGIRPRTSHLHLSFHVKVYASQSDEPTEYEWDESEDEEHSSPPGSSSVPARTAAQQLFTLVADDLKSLVITKDIFTADRSLFDRPLPSLRELTLVRHTDPSRLVPRGSTIRPLFPALTHLHVVAPELRSHPLLPGWIAHAPRVTHLRISPYDSMYELLEELPDAVGTPAYPFRRGFRVGMTIGPPAAVPARTYPTLAHVVVEPGSPPVKGACGTSRMAFSQRTMQLEWIAAQARQAGVEMYVPPPRARTEEELDEEIRAEWLKRVGGEPSRDWFDGAGEEEDSEDEDEVEDGDEDGDEAEDEVEDRKDAE